MFRRHLEAAVRSALLDTPVVFLRGGRQTGKSTLAEKLVRDGVLARYVTFDDATARSAARSAPEDFLAGFREPTVFDEVQRVPELTLALKRDVDQDRRPGRFLLTGSADPLLVPRLAESLAGRLELLTLWPLSQGEIEGVRESFVDRLFGEAAKWPEGKKLSRGGSLESRVSRGGFPEIQVRTDARRRRAWFGSYVSTILDRDVRDLSRIEGLSALPRLLSLLAARTATVPNLSEIARTSGIPHTTLNRYLTLLGATFLVSFVPAWSGNIGKRLVRSPKLFVTDTGLAASLLGFPDDPLGIEALRGPLLETFVGMEIVKQLTWSETPARLFHFRTHAGLEVDLVLEDPRGRLVGIEVKAGRSVSERDFRGLRALAGEEPRRFHRGVVLYSGENVVPFGRSLSAAPVRVLWSEVAGKARRRPSALSR
jgi:predicted AAA+ superfamily ATPase